MHAEMLIIRATPTAPAVAIYIDTVRVLSRVKKEIS